MAARGVAIFLLYNGGTSPARGGEPMAKGKSMRKEKKKPKQKQKKT